MQPGVGLVERCDTTLDRAYQTANRSRDAHALSACLCTCSSVIGQKQPASLSRDDNASGLTTMQTCRQRPQQPQFIISQPGEMEPAMFGQWGYQLGQAGIELVAFRQAILYLFVHLDRNVECAKQVA